MKKKKENGKERVKKPGNGKLKREIGGLALMLLALFLAGSTLTFHPGDQKVLDALPRLPWYDVLGLGVEPEVLDRLGNPFKLLGAKTASFFINTFLGYPSLLLFSAVFYWGLSLVRSISLKPALVYFLYATLLSVDLASLVGLMSFSGKGHFTGQIGQMLASKLDGLIGVGAWVLLVAIAAVPSFYLWQGAFPRSGSAEGSVEGSVEGPASPVPSRLFGRIRTIFGALRKKKADAPQAGPAPEVPFAGAAHSAETASAALRKAPEPPYSPGEADAPPIDDDGVEMVVHENAPEDSVDSDGRIVKKPAGEGDYCPPPIELLDKGPDKELGIDEVHLAESKRRLLEKLSIYKIEVVRIDATVGPRVTLFEMELAPDVKVSRVTSLENDLAMALAARGIRIIAPIPGKNAIGVEIPNSRPETVMLRSVLQAGKFTKNDYALPIVLGKTIANEVWVDDLAAMPHLLIAGATGSGKSVGINVILASLLYSCDPKKVKFVLVDPKRVELFHYQHIKEHFLLRFPGFDERIVTEPLKAVDALRSVVKEMELRYIRLEQAGVRNIKDYNAKMSEEKMFYIVVVVDELADLMITAGRDVEEPITRLAQLARAVGIHLIVATQRPSVDVITGIIKANFPSRIAFQVASKVDSRTILDCSGAEQLLGDGDMLYQSASMPRPVRLQGPFVSSGEVEAVTRYIARQPLPEDAAGVMMPKGDPGRRGGSDNGGAQSYGGDEGKDPAFDEAARLVVMSQQGSTSLLQRRLRLGFARAGRVMDQLEDAGIVGPQDGSRARDVLISDLSELEVRLNAPPEEDY